jgi:xylulokinase
VLDLPLELTAVEEGAAYGAALLAGIRAGVWRDAGEAVAACVRVRATIGPDASWQRAYEDGYGRFRSLYPALKEVR